MSGSVRCPDVTRLRSLAESPAGDPAGDPDLARHVAGCERCRKLVDLARREEVALRGAIPAEPPRDLLERVLSAVDKEASPAPRRPRPRRKGGSGPWIAGGALLAALALVLALREGPRETPPPPPEEPPPAQPVPRPRPAEVAPEPSVVAALPAIPPTPPADPEPPPPEAGKEGAPGTHPPENPPPPAPPELPGKAPTPPPATSAVALAHARSGKLTVSGRTLAAGEAIPESAAVQASSTAEVEGVGTAKLVLASGSRFNVRQGEHGETLFTLERGQVFARSQGEKPYAVATADGRATPLGTAFLVQVEPGKTHVVTLDGTVTLAVERSSATIVRAGFEADAVRGKPAALARPSALAKSALAWIPESSRPKKLPVIELVRSFSFADGLDGFGRGELAAQPGAHGSRSVLRGVASPEGTYAMNVQIEDARTKVLTIDPDLWIEAAVRVDRRTTVVLQVWDGDRKENLSRIVTVEPGAWTTIAAPLRDFTDSSGKPRATPVGKGDRGTCFSVFAGEANEKVELLVDDVRFYTQR
jgi:ferric-dicitrate binding protein FerR (iron transport regulator)